jgi:glutamine amidotransferase
VIALIDYRAGNLTSVRKALAAVGAEVFVPSAPADLASADGVIVPGVGHFGATRALDRAWVDAIGALLKAGRPILGICLGMQWLYEGSEEAPDLHGIGALQGSCARLIARDVKVPHVGWNSLNVSAQSSEAWIARGVPDGAHVYFTHSYAAPVTGDCVAVTQHGNSFAAMVERGPVAGVQFHPEKSGDVGLRILRNFVERAG